MPQKNSQKNLLTMVLNYLIFLTQNLLYSSFFFKKKNYTITKNYIHTTLKLILILKQIITSLFSPKKKNYLIMSDSTPSANDSGSSSTNPPPVLSYEDIIQGSISNAIPQPSISNGVATPETIIAVINDLLLVEMNSSKLAI
jgi:hypothetical protein